MRVFLAEDEALVKMLLIEFLNDLSCQVVTSVSTVDEAVRYAKFINVDLALLDVTLFDKAIFPAAKLFSARGVPIIFCTGYARSGLPDEWAAHPVLRKPYTKHDLERVLMEMKPT